jgi:very-short-patch-repair endonuclease
VSAKQARRLRKTETAAEKRLWAHLRNRRLAGLKFRRQHPLGRRVVDFFCVEAKLAVELDGSGHRRTSVKRLISIAKWNYMREAFGSFDLSITKCSRISMEF